MRRHAGLLVIASGSTGHHRNFVRATGARERDLGLVRPSILMEPRFTGLTFAFCSRGL